MTTIGILQTGEAPAELHAAFGDYPQMFQRWLHAQDASLEFRLYRSLQGELPTAIDECSGWLITGSRCSVLEQTGWMQALQDFIREGVSARTPLVGICFGHQIMAQALGGRVEQAAGGWCLGRHSYRLNGAPQGDGSVALNAFHQDQVVSAPAAASVLASSDSCPLAMLTYGDHALSIQAHPEFSNDFVQALAELRLRGQLPDSELDAVAAGLTAPPDAAWAARRALDVLQR